MNPAPCTGAQARTLFAPHALLPGGWAHDVLLRWDARGQLTQVQPGAACPAGVARAAGPLVPALPNLHSHAFQRGFAGLSEHRSAEHDSFWSWRALMYRFADRLTPERLQDVATWLYIEMLQAGYTQVCEFQYVHHQPDGRPYADDAALCQAVLGAAAQAGIGITLLPVLYQASGFGAQAPTEGQRRFVRATDDMLRLLERLIQVECRPEASFADAAAPRLGVAPHSLRAVPPPALRALTEGLHALDTSAPVHIHIAEQTREVEDCLAWSGQRPVEWLLNHAGVDARWCLVHATHMTPAEYRRAAASGAVAGLCPSTEANLGDGVFDLPAWRAAQGRWGIGSDSHVCVSAAEEVMLLEYSQRLARQARNVGATAGQLDTASALWLQAVAGGAQASGVPIAGLAVSQRADFVLLNPAHLALAGLPPAQSLAALVFASSRASAIDQVWVAGQCRVRGGRHPQRAAAQRAFIAARAALMH